MRRKKNDLDLSATILNDTPLEPVTLIKPKPSRAKTVPSLVEMAPEAGAPSNATKAVLRTTKLNVSKPPVEAQVTPAPSKTETKKGRSGLAFPLKSPRATKLKKVIVPAPLISTETASKPIIANVSADIDPVVTFRAAKTSPKPETSKPSASKHPRSKPTDRNPVAPDSAPVAVAKPRRSLFKEKAPAAVKTPILQPAQPPRDLTGDPVLDELPIPMWRAITEKPKPAGRRENKVTATDASSPEIAEETDGRSRRRRRGRGRDGGSESTGEGEPGTESETGVEEKPVGRQKRTQGRASRPDPHAITEETVSVSEDAVAPEALPTSIFRNRRLVPTVVTKPRIPVPAEAPQVVVRDGVPALTRAGRVYPPIFFFGSPADEKKAVTVLEELKMASDAGVHLHSFLVDFEVDPQSVDASVAFAAYMLAKSVELDPVCQILYRLVFHAPRGWQDKFPNSKYRTQDGATAEPSVCDDEFWGVARDCLQDFIKKMRMLPVADHILGVHLERGEWFLADGWGYDTSNAAQSQFRNWARTRYNNDEVTLRASWFDGTVRFDNLAIPEFQPEGTAEEKFIRTSRRQRRYVDYHLFLSDATVARIGDLAYAAKAASEGMFLVGASYGYTFEWSHPASCHLGLGKLLRTDEVDFIAGPPSYRNREPGGSAPFPVPIDSFALNGKLYLSEEDFKTSLSTGHEPDDFNPALKTPQALESVHWRGAGAALAHGSGMVWMDLWGNGWLKTNSIWERAAKVSRALVDRMKAPLGDPDVAIFIDERSLAYLVDPNAFTLLVQNVRESVLRAGISSGFYLLSDLAHREKFPESKLYIFLNAWDIRPELRAAIKNKLHRDNKVLLWLYSAGLFDAGRNSLERAREVTGIALKAQPFYSKSGTTLLNRRHPLSEAFPDKSLIGGTKLEPSYFAIPEGATVLGEYSQTGLPSFVVKEFKDDPENPWTSVFLGEPLVNPALIRSLAQMARAHIWNFSEDVVHVRAPFCTIHCAQAGPRSVTLPDKVSAYNLLTAQWAAVDTTNIRFNALEGSTHVFLVGPKVEIEHLLETDPSDVLRMNEIPERDINVALDGAGFDVPIMRLDEWMESTDQDEVADDWYLRMPTVEEEPAAPAEESAERVGRRRRRRGSRPGEQPSGFRQGGTEEVVTQRYEPSGGNGPAYEDLTMNVVFRKRE